MSDNVTPIGSAPSLRGDGALAASGRTDAPEPAPESDATTVSAVEPEEWAVPVDIHGASVPDSAADDATADDEEGYYQFALRSLGARAMSTGGLVKRLQKKGLTYAEAQRVVERVASAGYLDDAEFARVRIERLRERGQYGDRAIRQRLMQDGVPNTVIDEALSESPLDDPADLVLQAARDRASRLRGLDRAVAERRLTSYLQRRGHSGSEIRAAVQQALDEADDD